ncbi:hypothetical protein DFJ73DRAFT_568180 [Zopfochytrium polystomum]|nr:hypothetical protein DFJ73DRAFT_568180 [Zopfochytrium polystomum]
MCLPLMGRLRSGWLWMKRESATLGFKLEPWFNTNLECRDEDAEFEPTKQRSRRRGIPPVTPKASIRQDMMGYLFDDMWSEVMPFFQPAVIRGDDIPLKDANVSSTICAINDEDDEDTSLIDSVDPLMKAITIRPVSLQKRESSARTRSSVARNYLSSSEDFTYGAHRSPSTHSSLAQNLESALLAAITNVTASSVDGQQSRPTSARPLSARIAGSVRPSSARNLESLMQAGPGVASSATNNPQVQNGGQSGGRLQSAAGIRAGAGRNWKSRNNAGMRLLPLASMPPVASGPSNGSSSSLHDLVFGTSMTLAKTSQAQGWEGSRPSTSVGSSSKRLPPIRMTALNSNGLDQDLSSGQANFASGSTRPAPRHVLFDTAESPEMVSTSATKLARSSSPRPFSAKRQPSGNLRTRNSSSMTRPHTTMDESRLYSQQATVKSAGKRASVGGAPGGASGSAASAGASTVLSSAAGTGGVATASSNYLSLEERSLSPVMGTRFGRKGTNSNNNNIR